jgi:FMN phosphatase YigB (HAD superfamily)
MPSILVTDLGNVLLTIDPEIAWERLRKVAPQCADPQGVFRNVLKDTGYSQGKVSSLHFYQSVVEATRLNLSYPEFCEVFCDIFSEDLETLAVLRGFDVKQRHLLSNTNAIHWDWIQEKHPEVLRGFDRLWTSHEMGLEKPDPEIYRKVIEATGYPASEHVFIDDLEVNVSAAISVGMKGIVHTTAAKLRTELAKLR